MPPASPVALFDAAARAWFPRLTRSRAAATFARMKTARLTTESTLHGAAAVYYVYRHARAGPD